MRHELHTMKKRMRSQPTTPEGQNSSNRGFKFCLLQRGDQHIMGIPYTVLIVQSIDLFVMVQKGNCDLVREKGRQLNHIIYFYVVNLIII